MGKENSDSSSAYEMPDNSSSITVDINGIIEELKEILSSVGKSLRTNLQTSFKLTQEPTEETITVFTKINNTESLIKNWKYSNGSVILLNKITERGQLIVKYIPKKK